MKKLLLLSILITGLSPYSFIENKCNSFFVSKAEARFQDNCSRCRMELEKKEGDLRILRKQLRTLKNMRFYENKGYEVIFFTPKEDDLPSRIDILPSLKEGDSYSLIRRF